MAEIVAADNFESNFRENNASFLFWLLRFSPKCPFDIRSAFRN